MKYALNNRRFRLIIFLIILFGINTEAFSSVKAQSATTRAVITLANAPQVTSLKNPILSNAQSARWSADGKLFAIAGEAGVWLYGSDALTGAPQNFLNGPGLPAGLAFNPAGTLLAVSYTDDVIVWDTTTGDQQYSLVTHSGQVSALAFSPDGKILASGNFDGTIRLWDAASGHLIALLEDFISGINGLDFSADGSLLLSVGGNDLRIWDVAQQKVQLILDKQSNKPQIDFDTFAFYTSAQFSADARTILTVSSERGLQLWDATTGKTLSVPPLAITIRRFALSPDKSTLAVADNHGAISLWNAASLKPTKSLAPAQDEVDQLIFSPDGQLLSAIRDRHVEIWSLTGQKLYTLGAETPSGSENLAFSPDSRVLFAVGGFDKPTLWDTATLTVATTLDGSCYKSVAFSTDGSRVAADCGTIRVWNVSSGKLITTLNQSDVAQLAFKDDADHLVAVDTSNTIRVWDLSARRAKPSYLPARNGTFSPFDIISPDGQWITITADMDANNVTLRVWSLAENQVVLTLPPHPKPIGGLAFSADKSLLAVGLTNEVELWDTHSGQLRATLRGADDTPNAFITALAFSPDNTILATGNQARGIRLWDVNGGQQLAVLENDTGGFSGSVTRLAFSPDGTLLASAGWDGLRFWGVQ